MPILTYTFLLNVAMCAHLERRVIRASILFETMVAIDSGCYDHLSLRHIIRQLVASPLANHIPGMKIQNNQ